ELYGGTAAGKLLTALGRVLTIFLQWAGHTCGIEDLTLTDAAENARQEIILKSEGVGGEEQCAICWKSWMVLKRTRGTRLRQWMPMLRSRICKEWPILRLSEKRKWMMFVEGLRRFCWGK
ncbi:unnamed protein product, partial [Ascophyllum nodosum]